MLNMTIKTPTKYSIPLAFCLLFIQYCLFACAPTFLGGVPVELIEIKADNVQRDGVEFTIENESVGDAYWE